MINNRSRTIQHSRNFGTTKNYRPWNKRLDAIPLKMKVIYLDASKAGETQNLLKYGVPSYNLTAVSNDPEDYAGLERTIRNKSLGVKSYKEWVSDVIIDEQLLILDGMSTPYGTLEEKENIPYTVMKMLRSRKQWYHLEITLSQRSKNKGGKGDRERSNLYCVIEAMAHNMGHTIVGFDEEKYISTKGSPMVNMYFLFKKTNRRINLIRGDDLNYQIFVMFRAWRLNSPKSVWNFHNLMQ